MPPIWTHRLGGPADGISVARESGQLLAWDRRAWLVMLNRRGEPQGQIHLDAPLVAAAFSDDGSAMGIADQRGKLSWLAPDLSSRWNARLPQRPTALAIDPLGRGLAVADTSHRLRFFDAEGHETRAAIETSRTLVHLVFSPSSAVLFAAADFGLLGAIDSVGRWLWQDAPVVHIGGIACSGDGKLLAASCFSEGIRRYDGAGQPQPVLPTPQPCRAVALTYDGKFAVIADTNGTVLALNASGKTLWQLADDQPVIDFGLAPLGDYLVVAHSDGRIVALDISDALR